MQHVLKTSYSSDQPVSMPLKRPGVSPKQPTKAGEGGGVARTVQRAMKNTAKQSASGLTVH